MPKCKYRCVSNDGSMCCEGSLDGYFCTLSEGHEGPHIACGVETHDIRVWRDEDRMTSRTTERKWQMFQVRTKRASFRVSFKRVVSLRNRTTNPTVFDTVCRMVVDDGDGECHYTGTARQSVQDVYDKQKGRKIALGRALKKALALEDVDKDERRAVWKSYFNSVSNGNDGKE